jgi:hypothetical protein
MQLQTNLAHNGSNSWGLTPRLTVVENACRQLLDERGTMSGAFRRALVRLLPWGPVNTQRLLCSSASISGCWCGCSESC